MANIEQLKLLWMKIVVWLSLRFRNDHVVLTKEQMMAINGFSGKLGWGVQYFSFLQNKKTKDLQVCVQGFDEKSDQSFLTDVFTITINGTIIPRK